MLTIAGVTHTWAALHHLQRWTSRNLRTYFGSEVYMRAEGCERDGMVELVGVSLGCISGRVQEGDGTTTPHTVAITTVGTEIQCRCSCDSSTCHHLAAFLLSVSKADKGVVAPFVCGCDPGDFSYLGFLMTFRSMEELVIQLDSVVSKSSKRDALNEMLAALPTQPKGKGRKAVNKKLLAVENKINDVLDETKVEGEEISESLEAPLNMLKPYFKTNPDDVLRILEAVIESACKDDYDSPSLQEYDNEGWGEQGNEFETEHMCKLCVDFVLSQPDDKRVSYLAALTECNKTHRKTYQSGYSLIANGPSFIFVDEICTHSAEELGPSLLNFVVGPEYLREHSDDEKKLIMKRFQSTLTSAMQLEHKIELAKESTEGKISLIKHYVEEMKEPLRAIPWVDEVLESGASGGVADLYWFRVQLAETHEGGPDAALVWIEKGVKVQPAKFIQEACQKRPDKAHEFELIFASRFAREYADYLLKSRRFDDLGAHLSKHNQYIGEYSLLAYMGHESVSRFAGDIQIVQSILNRELSTGNYDSIARVYKVLAKVDPEAALVAGSEIHSKHKGE